MMFSLLHATRGRKEPIEQCPTWWRNNWSGENDYEYLFSTDSDDMTLVEVVKKGPLTLDKCLPVTGPPEGNCAAYNRAAAKATGTIFIQVMDDVQPPPGWDKRILAAFDGRPLCKPWVMGVGDCGYGTQKGICTVMVCTKAWYDRCGYLYYPEYHSMFADDDITEKARLEGCLIEAWDKVTFPHMWKMWGEDEVWRETNSQKWRTQGAALLAKRRVCDFKDTVRDTD